ncbi:hypothetical protein PoB_002011400 [Plakobranchus ocellatus]|uniref:Uncharacterized protein n=1 Tax=Plakobranchus ocellatus TaxID=259542 RepID=A0AAV3ZI97_9GAST|nr:hypothetical protein PoB_002011400 [Plakobranchus ocellatus]
MSGQRHPPPPPTTATAISIEHTQQQLKRNETKHSKAELDFRSHTLQVSGVVIETRSRGQRGGRRGEANAALQRIRQEG